MKLLQTLPLIPESTDSIASKAQQEITALKSLSFDDLVARIAQDAVQFAIHLAIAILVFYVGKLIIKKLYRVADAVMTRRAVDRSLTTFVLSLIRIVLYFILIVTVISILGIETSSFIAIFASAGVAIGMALSGTLQNFAGGVLILLLKPYKIGDYIEAQGFGGTVTEIQIFNTIISTADNKSIIIPNGGLSTGSINNWSREMFRRVDWSIGISYGNSVETARKAILEMLEADSRIVSTNFADYCEKMHLQLQQSQTPQRQRLEDEREKRRGWLYRLFHRQRAKVRNTLNDPMRPTRLDDRNQADRHPVVVVTELADSSVNLSVRAWCTSADYWGVFFDFNERFYTELPSKGVDFPFPQLDVHIGNEQ